MKLLETQVAYFKSLSSKAQTRTIGSILDEIQTGKHARAIEALRQPGLSEEQRKRRKCELPAFMASGTSKGSHKAIDFLQHSGLLQIDLDHLGQDRAPALRDAIGRYPHIFASFISPSGTGVKALMLIPASKDTHQAAFAAAVEYFHHGYGLEIDPKCKDISRLCFVSHDPGLVLNLDCSPLASPCPQSEQESSPQSEQQGEILGARASLHNNNSSESLQPESCVLYNNDIWRDWPQLEPLYRRNVSQLYGNVQRGTRNPAIVEISARLFHYVKPEFVALMLDAYRQEHHKVFADYSPADFAREVRAMLIGCEHTFQEELNERERRAYLDLPEQERPAFRIARSLSNCVSNAELPPPMFHLSCHELAVRLGLLDPQAGRILQKLERLGVIEKVTPGTKHQKGQRGTATVWRWLLIEESISQPG